MDEKDLLTVQEVAEILGVNQNSVYVATSEGRLPFTEAFGRKVIKRVDVEAYQQRTRASGEKPKGRPKGSTNRTKSETIGSAASGWQSIQDAQKR